MTFFWLLGLRRFFGGVLGGGLMRDGFCDRDPPHRNSLLAPYDQAPSPAALSDVSMAVLLWGKHLGGGLSKGTVLGLFRWRVGTARASNAGRSHRAAAAGAGRAESALGHAPKMPNTITADCFMTLAHASVQILEYTWVFQLLVL